MKTTGSKRKSVSYQNLQSYPRYQGATSDIASGIDQANLALKSGLESRMKAKSEMMKQQMALNKSEAMARLQDELARQRGADLATLKDELMRKRQAEQQPFKEYESFSRKTDQPTTFQDFLAKRQVQGVSPEQLEVKPGGVFLTPEALETQRGKLPQEEQMTFKPPMPEQKPSEIGNLMQFLVGKAQAAPPSFAPRSMKPKEFGSVEEADKANLPKGTMVLIGGRRARVD